MKLTIIIDQIANDLGGTEGQIVKLLKGLSTRHEIDLIVFQRSDWLVQATAWLPCRVHIIELGGVTKPAFYRGLWKLWRLLKQRQPDVVHTFFPIANVVGVLMARLAGVKGVLASRRDYGYWITPGYLKATRFANRFVDSIVANSPQVRAFTERIEGVPADRLEVIYNGVDLEALHRDGPNLALKDKLGIPRHHRVIALVANYRPIKRHDTLLHATRALIDKHPDISLLFVGANNAADPCMDEVLALAQSLGLQDRVHRGHAKGDIADYLSIMHIGCNCSESEGLSNAVIEYMAAGIPAIVSNGGGNPDLVLDGIDGLVFPVGDHQALAEKLDLLLSNEEIRKQYALAGQNKVRREMALPVMLDRFERHYKSAAGLR
ncbi:glycosyltransferase [Aquabacterium sp.]|uniref:glycosyltransferase n=1 Tax=Aquabacterium sp. TaxID=1872578 RepID=UPI002E37AC5C|nr:glycosyltransferase [Aquabacterium sp.]HEX5311187.1 glycosyltransferase [Aquabacterium sp.]